MSKVNNLLETLPETSHTFTLDLIGRITKRRYLGEFVCKIPTLKDQALIDKHRAFLDGEFPIYLKPGIKKLHEQIAYLRFVLTDIPKFWRESDLGYDLRDDNIVEAVYDEVIAFENKWLMAVWEVKEDGSDAEKES